MKGFGRGRKIRICRINKGKGMLKVERLEEGCKRGIVKSGEVIVGEDGS